MSTRLAGAVAVIDMSAFSHCVQYVVLLPSDEPSM
jgi:hypothetical protein